MELAESRLEAPDSAALHPGYLLCAIDRRAEREQMRYTAERYNE
jgi:hypothetical protein